MGYPKEYYSILESYDKGLIDTLPENVMKMLRDIYRVARGDMSDCPVFHDRRLIPKMGLYSYVSDKLKKELLIDCAKYSSMRSLPDTMITDRKLMPSIVSKNPAAIMLFRTDRDLVLDAVKVNGKVLIYVDKYRYDDEIRDAALEQDPSIWGSIQMPMGLAPDIDSDDENEVREALLDGSARLIDVSRSYADNKELVIQLVRKDPSVFSRISDRLKKDRDIILTVLSNSTETMVDIDTSDQEMLWKFARRFIL